MKDKRQKVKKILNDYTKQVNLVIGSLMISHNIDLSDLPKTEEITDKIMKIVEDK